jgi:hypothetical protein
MVKRRMKKADKFTQGYLCALSQIYKSHGGNMAIDEALEAAAVDDIDPLSISKFDREMLIKFQKEGST